MKEFIFSFLSTIFQMDLMDTHSTPFALPLMVAVLFSGTFGFVIFRMVGNERPDENETKEEVANREAREQRTASEVN